MPTEWFRRKQGADRVKEQLMRRIKMEQIGEDEGIVAQ
jgi:hypothetical protein